MTVPELLGEFSVQELGCALYQASLPQSGPKAERIERLAAFSIRANLSGEQLLDLFTAEALRIVCGNLGLQTGRKADMVRALAG